MKLGFFTMPIHPLEKDWRQSLREDREAFVLADELGFTEGLCRRARYRSGRKHHLLRRVPGLDCGGDQADQARYRHHQHAEHPSGGDRREPCDARSHAGRPVDLRHQPGRAFVGRRTVRQSRCQPQRDVPGSDQPGSRDLGQRSALQHQGQILEHLGRTDADRGYRPRLHRQAVATAASADRGHGGGAVLEGRHGGGRSRLGSDLGELPDAGLGEKPLAEICRGLRTRRPACRSRQLARRQKRVRRQGRGDGQGLCDRSRRALRLSITVRSSPS